MASTQKYTTNSAEQMQYFYSMRLLTAAVANFPHARVAQLGGTPKETIPDQNGDTVSWRKFSELDAATTPAPVYPNWFIDDMVDAPSRAALLGGGQMP